MLCGVSNIIHCPVEGYLVWLGRSSETAQLSDELKRRCSNLIRRGRWTEVMKCFDGSAHVRTINDPRSAINSVVLTADYTDEMDLPIGIPVSDGCEWRSL